MPPSHPACLILVREFIILLFTLAPSKESGFIGQRRQVYNCGGCTGLIKFQLDDLSGELELSGDDPAVEDPGEIDPEKEKKSGTIISGTLDEITSSELLQFFYMHQKTGKLLLQVSGGLGRIAVISRRCNHRT